MHKKTRHRVGRGFAALVVSAGFAGFASCTSFTVRPGEPGPEGDRLPMPIVAPATEPGADPRITTSGDIGVEPRNPRDFAIEALHELLRLQDSYHRRHARYSRFLEDLDYRGSPGVSVRIVRATRDGWSAIARVTQVRLECAIFQGRVSAPRPYASRAGVPACPRDLAAPRSDLNAVHSLACVLLSSRSSYRAEDDDRKRTRVNNPGKL